MDLTLHKDLWFSATYVVGDTPIVLSRAANGKWRFEIQSAGFNSFEDSNSDLFAQPFSSRTEAMSYLQARISTGLQLPHTTLASMNCLQRDQDGDYVAELTDELGVRRRFIIQRQSRGWSINEGDYFRWCNSLWWVRRKLAERVAGRIS